MSFKALLRTLLITSAFISYAYGFPTFQWPNPLLAYADKQVFTGSVGGFVEGCPPRDDTTVPAQWLRLAYHDMATHDIDNGTGGLDASIQFELARPQNIGLGMAESLSDFASFQIVTPFFGLADMIALGAIAAVSACGGPLIPFSAGRVDATVAGPATVPQPQQSLASHIESFRRQGFNQTEMIALVACGHTLGGVRQADFPLIVTDDTIVVDTFDTTPAFDNTIVSQYLQNTTQDILVVGPNVTTRSDFRIFSSDGNATMQNLLSSDVFEETCGALIQRLVNTVPDGVNLTEPISEPFDYIVSQPCFSYQSDSFIMTTTLRVLNVSSSSTVTMLWADRQGSCCPPAGCSVESSSVQEVSFTEFGALVAGGITADLFFFNATINATCSISNFWFEVDANDGSKPAVVNNTGGGYEIEQDSLFVDSLRSGTVFPIVTETSFDFLINVVVAIQGDADSSSVSFTSIFDPASAATVPPFTPTITSASLQLDDSNPPEGGFTFFTTNVSLTASYVDILANAGGVTYALENFDLGDLLL